MSFVIEYGSEYENPVSDGKVEAEIGYLQWIGSRQSIEPIDILEYYSTQNIFYAICMKVADRTLGHLEFVFRFRGQDYQINPDGSISNLPADFLERLSQYLKEVPALV